MAEGEGIAPCSLIYPYFENPEMLEHQVSVWERYSGDLTYNMEFVLVDDCSQKHPALPIFKKLKHRKKLFRFKERIPWNQHQARNLGAFNAEPRKEITNPWLFLSDIDIVLTAEAAYTMLSKKLDAGRHYRVNRTFAPDFTEHKIHPNTFLLTKRVFQYLNGYDCDLIPVGGGGYGGDGEFARQLQGVVPGEYLEDVMTLGFGRRNRNVPPTEILDADTTDLDRDEWSKKYREAFNKKRGKGDMRSINPIRTPFERLL